MPQPGEGSGLDENRGGNDGDLALAVLALLIPAQVPREPAKDLFLHSAQAPGMEIRFVDYHWQPAIFEAMEKGNGAVPEATRNWVIVRVILTSRPLTWVTRGCRSGTMRLPSGPTSTARGWPSRCGRSTCARSTPT